MGVKGLMPKNAYHFHQGAPNALCAKRVRLQGERTARRCDRPRDHPIHRYYRCPAEKCRDKKFWSIDHLARHREDRHRERRA